MIITPKNHLQLNRNNSPRHQRSVNFRGFQEDAHSSIHCLSYPSHPYSSHNFFLINLDGSENLTNKPETRQSSHCTCNQQQCRADQEHVSKVQKISDEHLGGIQTTEPEETVDVRVERSASGGEEGEPPPSVIFGTELVITEEDRDFSAGDEEDEVDH